MWTKGAKKFEIYPRAYKFIKLQNSHGYHLHVELDGTVTLLSPDEKPTFYTYFTPVTSKFGGFALLGKNGKFLSTTKDGEVVCNRERITEAESLVFI